MKALVLTALFVALPALALDGVDPRVYLSARRPVPDVVRELKHAPLAVSLKILVDGPESFLAPLTAYPAALKEHEVAALRAGERRALVVGALAAVADKNPANAVALIAPWLRVDDAVLRAEAAERLGETRADVTGTLAEIAKNDADASVRAAACAGLGRHRSPEALDALAPFVVDARDPTRQLAAVRALGVLGSRWAWQARGDVVTGDRVRADARALLAHVEKNGEVARAVADVERVLR